MRFVLASASPARLSVLRAAGIDPVVRISGVDEDAVTATLSDSDPEALVTGLAAAKAEAVVAEIAHEFTEAVIVGCDSMLWMPDDEHEHNKPVGKPDTPEVAARRWKRMAGHTGELLTGHAVIRLHDGQVWKRARSHSGTTIRFGTPSDAEIEAYLATGEPLKVAGGFTLDGFGGWFVEGVDGDPSSVIGISLPLTRELLAEVNLSVVSLWR